MVVLVGLTGAQQLGRAQAYGFMCGALDVWDLLGGRQDPH
jgi:hypothetical protein